MATTTRRRQPNDFDIHEDGPSTEDTEMNTDAVNEEQVEEEEYAEEVIAEEPEEEDQVQDPEVEPESEQEQEQEQEQEEDDFSEDEAMDEDMKRLQDAFPGFRNKYRLIKRIGEGTLLQPSNGDRNMVLLISFQAHSLPSTRLKTFNTKRTTTNGTWTRKTKSGRLLLSRGMSTGALPPHWIILLKRHTTPAHADAQNMSPSRKSTSHPPHSAF